MVAAQQFEVAGVPQCSRQQEDYRTGTCGVSHDMHVTCHCKKYSSLL